MPGGGGTYTMIDVGEGVGGGMTDEGGGAPHWLAYVGVDDVRAKTAQAKSLGATVLQDVASRRIRHDERHPRSFRCRDRALAAVAADARQIRCGRVSALARPYMPVSIALPIAFALTMKPTSEALASFGTSSFAPSAHRA